MTAARTLLPLSLFAILATASPRARADEVNVVLESTNPNITLNRVTGQASAFAIGAGGHASADATSWEMVCVAPCNKALDRQAEYFIGGNGVTPSQHFVLPAADRLKLQVDAGSQNTRVLGFLLTVLGSVAAVTGGAFAALEDTRVAGAVVGGGGLLTLIPGLIMIGTSGTDVLADGRTIARRAPAKSVAGSTGLSF